MKTIPTDMRHNAEPESRPLLYRIPSAMQQLAVSRATIYRMAARGELEMVRIGVRTCHITSESLIRLLDTLRSQGRSAHPSDPGGKDQ